MRFLRSSSVSLRNLPSGHKHDGGTGVAVSSSAFDSIILEASASSSVRPAAPLLYPLTRIVPNLGVLLVTSVFNQSFGKQYGKQGHRNPQQPAVGLHHKPWSWHGIQRTTNPSRHALADCCACPFGPYGNQSLPGLAAAFVLVAFRRIDGAYLVLSSGSTIANGRSRPCGTLIQFG
jgi:hypothetical protein